MNNISIKEYMDLAKERLEGLSAEDLQTILLEQAKKAKPSERIFFLQSLTPPPKKETGEAEPDDELLDEILDFSEKVENGNYCTGWGWDNEIRKEREWGDESWADEADDFFELIREEYEDGHFELAAKAYEELFFALSMGQEPGHLPGHPDFTEMLSTDLSEEYLIYLRTVYMLEPLSKRPEALLKGINEKSYSFGGKVTLQKINDAGESSLPEFDDFLPVWINYLQETGSNQDLLREAVKMSGGIPALASLARQEGHKHPKNFVEWINTLEETKDYLAVQEAALEGLAIVPVNYVIRAKIAQGLIRSASALGDKQGQLKGWREAFCSKPDISSYLSLIDVAEQSGQLEEETNATVDWTIALLHKEKDNEIISFNDYEENKKSSASQYLLTQMYMVNGNHQKVFMMIHDNNGQENGHAHSIKGLALPYFLNLLGKKTGSFPMANVQSLWIYAVDSFDYHSCESVLSKQLKRAVESVNKQISLTEEEEVIYLDWCKAEVEKRTVDIVSNQHRGYYQLAACLILSLSELWVGRGKRAEGFNLIQKYHQKYHRHRSFRQELTNATLKSGIF